jgi:hypothetical protein
MSVALMSDIGKLQRTKALLQTLWAARIRRLPPKNRREQLRRL